MKKAILIKAKCNIDPTPPGVLHIMQKEREKERKQREGERAIHYCVQSQPCQ